MSRITRRDAVTGLVSTTTVAVLGSHLPAAAQPVQEKLLPERDALHGEAFMKFQRFIRLSAVLTGISEVQLTPTSGSANPPDPPATGGVDPVEEHKLAYFKLASGAPGYADLLSAFESSLDPSVRRDPQKLDGIAKALLTSEKPGVKELARSIIMVWYFGVWYQWPKDRSGKPRFTVVSADAYTQGWVWRIAQAHPPGYSNLRFGYWAFAPSDALKLDTIRLKVLTT